MARRLLIILICLIAAVPALAQDDDRPVVQTISYNQTVTETISDIAIFDWWQLTATTGDIIVVEMDASDGLIPLLGILNAGGELVANTDMEVSPGVNEIIRLQYVAEEDIQYTIVATRFGNNDGTSTGSYTLSVWKAQETSTRENPYLAVEFRCDDLLVTTAFSVEITEDVVIPEGAASDTVVEDYRITVYGLDGFHPVIRVFASVQEDRLDCTDDGQLTPGSTYTLPDGTTATITDDTTDSVAQLSLRSRGGQDIFGTISITVGSLNGAPGRYIAVLEGLSLYNKRDADRYVVRLGPLARDTNLTVYTVGDTDSRLDPTIHQMVDDEEIAFTCDDAGRHDCESVPSFDGAGIQLTDGTVIQGDRFDAGLVLNPGTPAPQYIEVISRAGSTEGGYSLVFIGEIPAR